MLSTGANHHPVTGASPAAPEDVAPAQARAGSAAGHPLSGKRIYIPPMAWGSARAFASAFRAIGLDAEPTPPSDNRTRELGARYTSGDECYPAKVTVGDFMKVLERPGIDPASVAFFMPTAEGPCRFGQYAPYLRQILDAHGQQAVEILSPTSRNAYQGLGTLAKPFVRTGWRALFCADMLQKMLLIERPYEECRGETEAVYEEALADLCATLEQSPVEPGVQLRACAIPWCAAATASVRWLRAATAACRLSASWARSSAASTLFPTRTWSAAWKPTAPKPGYRTWWSGSGIPTPSTSASSS
jgi:hypothetical protein